MPFHGYSAAALGTFLPVGQGIRFPAGQGVLAFYVAITAFAFDHMGVLIHKQTLCIFVAVGCGDLYLPGGITGGAGLGLFTRIATGRFLDDLIAAPAVFCLVGLAAQGTGLAVVGAVQLAPGAVAVGAGCLLAFGAGS